MAGKTGTAHRQRMIEDDQLIAFTTFGRNIPGFQGSAVVGRDLEVAPAAHAIIVRRLVNHAAQRSNDGGEIFDLPVIFFGDGFELFQGLFHSFFGYSGHDVFGRL